MAGARGGQRVSGVSGGVLVDVGARVVGVGQDVCDRGHVLGGVGDGIGGVVGVRTPVGGVGRDVVGDLRAAVIDIGGDVWRDIGHVGATHGVDSGGIADVDRGAVVAAGILRDVGRTAADGHVRAGRAEDDGPRGRVPEEIGEGSRADTMRHGNLAERGRRARKT